MIRRARLPARSAEILRFAAVGVAATATYGLAAATLDRLGMAPILASLLAYGVGGGVSYLGHKRVTFRSDGAHRAEAPRFLAGFAFGLALAAAIPALVTRSLGLSPDAATLITCAATPPLNYLVLRRLVFRRGERRRSRQPSPDRRPGRAGSASNVDRSSPGPSALPTPAEAS